MRDDELMGIGRFARLSGLSAHALRHYDDVGLLAPAEVDAVTGYRRYRAGQIQAARLIRALRWTDLPVEGVRKILNSGPGEESRAVLASHLARLNRLHSRVTAQINDVNRFLEKGPEMPAAHTGCRPVQIMIAVEDKKQATQFYQAVMGGRYDVAQRTGHGDRSAFIFGEYGRADFFLLWLLDDPDRLDRPGRSAIGLLTDDVDAAHQRALAAGGAEAVAPRDAEGMPRHSAVTDPAGNWVWLFHDGRQGTRPVQLTLAVGDAAAAAEFYQQAFGLQYEVSRHTRELDHFALRSGQYGQDGFFLIWLADDRERLDLPGPANFSLLADDLDAGHQRALTAGATEITPPHDTEGMPRNSAVRDPDGNWIGLAQG